MVEELIKTFVKTGKFTAHEIVLSPKITEAWVRFRVDPNRFLPQIFDGDWARPNKHPEAASIRLLRIIAGNDGVYRLIGRQGTFVYATPWIGV